MSRQSRYCDHLIYGCMAVFAFSLPFSIAISQGALLLALVGWAAKTAFEKNLNWERTPADYALLAFIASGVVSALLGADILKSLAGLRTFWTFLIIHLLYNNVREAGRAKMLLSILFAGAAASAFYSSAAGIRELFAGVQPDLIGSMTLAGKLMLICGLASACLLHKKNPKERAVFAALVFALAAAVLLQFKRGSWLALVCIFIVQGAVVSPKRIAYILAAAVLVFALFSPARERMLGFRSEFEPEAGGRGAMWRAAPRIIRDFPLGAGLDNAGALMYGYDPSIELKEGREPHSHLHNTYLQVLVEMGPQGLAAFIWLLAVFINAPRRLYRRIPGRYTFEKGLALGAFSAMCGFLVNGLVEHNFGDSEVAMLVFFMTGLVFILGRATPGEPGSAGPEENSGNTEIC